MRDRVRVATYMLVRLEQLHLVGAREGVRRTEAGDARADDRYLHLNGDSSHPRLLDD